MIVNYYDTLKWLRQSAKNCSMMDIDCANCAGDDCEGHEQVIFLAAVDAIEELCSVLREIASAAMIYDSEQATEVILRKLRKVGVTYVDEAGYWVLTEREER